MSRMNVEREKMVIPQQNGMKSVFEVLEDLPFPFPFSPIYQPTRLMRQRRMTLTDSLPGCGDDGDVGACCTPALHQNEQDEAHLSGGSWDKFPVCL